MSPRLCAHDASMTSWQSLFSSLGSVYQAQPEAEAGRRADVRLFAADRPVLPRRTLIGLRWLAIAGQLTVVAIVAGWLRAPVPLVFVGGAIAISAVVNLMLTCERRAGPMLSERAAAAQLAFDLAQLAAVLYMTGGICNPFSVMILVPVTIAASLLNTRAMLIFLAFALTLLLAIALQPWPLPWPDPEPFALPDIYVFAIWGALSIAMVFVALYANRVTAEGRRGVAALDAARAALERERQLADLGALAAAAAHQLGTPLGTITLTLKELLAEVPQEAPWRADLEVMMTEAERCRQALERLRARDFAKDTHPFDSQPVEAILREAARPFEERSRLRFVITARPGNRATADHAVQPRLPRRPEILHALANFIENAVSFARSEVSLAARWDAHALVVTIADDGPGFAEEVIDRLGEPYVTTRRGGLGTHAPPGESGLGFGLGVYIAVSLLARTGAKVRFRNGTQGGAIVTITWSRQGALAGGGLPQESPSESGLEKRPRGRLN